MGALVFHSGTARQGERLVTNGGRILSVTGVAPELGQARALAYAGAGAVSFAGARYRGRGFPPPGGSWDPRRRRVPGEQKADIYQWFPKGDPSLVAFGIRASKKDRNSRALPHFSSMGQEDQ